MPILSQMNLSELSKIRELNSKNKKNNSKEESEINEINFSKDNFNEGIPPILVPTLKKTRKLSIQIPKNRDLEYQMNVN